MSGVAIQHQFIQGTEPETKTGKAKNQQTILSHSEIETCNFKPEQGEERMVVQTHQTRTLWPP